jgi:hypothetical protein
LTVKRHRNHCRFCIVLEGHFPEKDVAVAKKRVSGGSIHCRPSPAVATTTNILA